MTLLNDRINPDIAALSDDWEALADAGRRVTNDQDENRWKYGDLAIRVARRYGEESIAQFAADIGLRSAKTLYDYHRVSAFFPYGLRQEFPALFWSHYREALRVEDLEGAMDMLAKASDGNWTVDYMRVEINKLLAQRPSAQVNGETNHWKHRLTLEVKILHLGEEKMHVLRLDPSIDLTDKLESGQPYKFVIYAMREE